MDYELLERIDCTPATLGAVDHWDLFISAYNKSARVQQPFDAVQATEKHWFVHPEYDFAAADLPAGDCYVVDTRDEAEAWQQYFQMSDADSWPKGHRVCVDLTGFMRPHLMLLPLLLRLRGFDTLDAIYSEPLYYESGAKTRFSKGAVTEIRQVRGFEGSHQQDAGDEDLLVLGAGYDDQLIRNVADAKRAARKIEMFGLPSLQPHMYEENRLQAARADEAVGALGEREHIFAPANDPFVTAQELHHRIQREEPDGLLNLYLSPLATKPQALGFALYYLTERVDTATSMLFPFAQYYSQETAMGWSRTSVYRLELDWFDV